MQGFIKAQYGHTLVLEVDNLPKIKADVECDISIKPKGKKRSKDANAYFHVLVDALRQALKISFTSCKNELITSYGQIEYMDDEPAYVVSNIPPDYVREQEQPHMKWVGMTEGMYRYLVYRGSHTYNTAEMALLIDGTIQECKMQDIETATPNEIAKMLQVWSERITKQRGE